MKQNEITKCLVCGEGIAHDGNIQFFRITIESLLLNLGAIQRQHGLEMMMGKAAGLAQVMGMDEDLAKTYAKESGLICQPCFMGPDADVAMILKSLNDAAKDNKEKGLLNADP